MLYTLLLVVGVNSFIVDHNLTRDECYNKLWSGWSSTLGFFYYKDEVVNVVGTNASIVCVPDDTFINHNSR